MRRHHPQPVRHRITRPRTPMLYTCIICEQPCETLGTCGARACKKTWRRELQHGIDTAQFEREWVQTTPWPVRQAQYRRLLRALYDDWRTMLARHPLTHDDLSDVLVGGLPLVIGLIPLHQLVRRQEAGYRRLVRASVQRCRQALRDLPRDADPAQRHYLQEYLRTMRHRAADHRRERATGRSLATLTVQLYYEQPDLVPVMTRFYARRARRALTQVAADDHTR